MAGNFRGSVARTNSQRSPRHRSHVFHLKYESLLHEIVNKNVFGKAVANVYTIEYQKWGSLTCNSSFSLILPLDSPLCHALTHLSVLNFWTAVLNLLSLTWSKSLCSMAHVTVINV